MTGINRKKRDVKENSKVDVADTEDQLAQIRRLTQIGRALSAEKNLDKLLEMIVFEARKFTNANGGTLYIMSDNEDELQFAIIQNESLKIKMGGTGGKIVWTPVKLRNHDGSPNYTHVSAYAALSGEVINIPDVYDADGFNFEGTRHFDAETGFKSTSMLVVPMRNHENDIIGVLQLLDARDAKSGDVIAFSMESQELTESLASQAAVALSNNRLIHDLENLFDSFIRTIAAAIDEKSPYTGGHVRRVVDIAMAITEKINETNEGPFAGVKFSQDQLNELRIAAWLHDVGKITTPEYVVDKSKKLETIHDRMEIIKTRFEILKRDHEIELMKQGMNGRKKLKKGSDGLQEHHAKAEEELKFLSSANSGIDFMTDDMIDKVKEIAKRQWKLDGSFQPLLSDDEVYNISVRKGTLTDEERDIINNHTVVTYKILSQLHFPKKLRNVPTYAAAHHEKMNGSGYPMGLTGDRISLQSRILALADIFEALTAKDRPYKKGHTLSEAIDVMGFMVKDHHIDADLFDLFIGKGIHLEYAQKELLSRPADET